METDALFLELLRIALSGGGKLSRTPSEQEWEAILNACVKQSVVGIGFCGVELLPKEQMPCLDMIMDWSAVVSCIEEDNRKLNALCVKICDIFHQEGINATILKGQGMGALYDAPLRRMSGDIDVWMEGGKDRVVPYIKKNFPRRADEGDGGHHIAVEIKGGVEMEVHWTPALMYSKSNAKKFDRWIREVEAEQWKHTIALPENVGEINVPTFEFNSVFILLHMFHHWAFEGCGMKQMLDYFYLLKRRPLDKKWQGKALISSFWMNGFLGAMMWIMKELGMDSDHLLCEPNERLGRRLLKEILEVGTVSADDLLTGKYGQEGKIHKTFRRFFRAVSMAPYAPLEMHYMFWTNIYAYLRGRTR